MDLPVASCVDFYTVRTLLGRLGGLGRLLVLVLLRGLGVASLLVDVDFLTVLGTANALLLGDVHFLLDVGVGLGGMDGGGEGFVDLFFVTFPSV
jgi:hypothetical protein